MNWFVCGHIVPAVKTAMGTNLKGRQTINFQGIKTLMGIQAVMGIQAAMGIQAVMGI